MPEKKYTPNKRNQRVQKPSIRKHRPTKLNLHADMVEANLTITLVEIVGGKTKRYRACANNNPSTFSFMRKAIVADLAKYPRLYPSKGKTNMAIFRCKQNNRLYLSTYKVSEQLKKAA